MPDDLHLESVLTSLYVLYSFSTQMINVGVKSVCGVLIRSRFVDFAQSITGARLNTSTDGNASFPCFPEEVLDVLR